MVVVIVVDVMLDDVVEDVIDVVVDDTLEVVVDVVVVLEHNPHFAGQRGATPSVSQVATPQNSGSAIP